MSQSLHAPTADGSILAKPPLAEVGDLLQSSAHCFSSYTGSGIAFGNFAQIRQLARREFLARARAYLTSLGEPLPRSLPDPAPLLLAGHQPEMFHPGVWIKNFALTGLARRHGAVAVNLIVDNDTCKSTQIAVPLPPPQAPRLGKVAFDRWQSEQVWEERLVLDASLFTRFAEEVCQHLHRWGVRPLLADYWPEVQRALQKTGRVGAAFAAARRSLERHWGCHNLEVPLSVVCRGESFAWLAGTLLADLPRFVGIYNAVVADYRAAQGIRSRNHPVPDLMVEGDWLEAPLWIWRAGSGRRCRLLVRHGKDRLQLRSGNDSYPDLPLPSRGSEFLTAFRALAEQGICIRTRALTTTMLARLLLGDVFVHGIGGGKYDELTDALFRRFWGLEPPPYVILTATRWLGLALPDADPAERLHLKHLLRDLQHNPQRHLNANKRTAFRHLLEQQQHWIDQQPADHRGRQQRFRALLHLDGLLRPAVADQLVAVAHRLRHLDEQLAARAVLTRRDYAFPLYTEDRLRPFLTALLDE